MTVPLMVLAVGAVLRGLPRHPGRAGPYRSHPPNLFEGFLHPVLANAHHALEQVFPDPLADEGTEWALMARAWRWPSPASSWPATLYKSRPELSDRRGGGASHASIGCSRTSTTWTRSTARSFVRGVALGGGSRCCTRWTGWWWTAATARCGLARASTAWPGCTRDVVAMFSNAWDRYVVDDAGERRGRGARQPQLPLPVRAERACAALRAAAMIIGLFFLISPGAGPCGLY